MEHKKYSLESLIYVAFLLFVSLNCSHKHPERELAVHFNGKYGQIEIGSKYVGAEFHHSRPLPSRISFYYPLANSIDLSTDYWKRYQSLPFTVVLMVDGIMDTLGQEGYEYYYTPFAATFEKHYDEYEIEFSYEFCDDLPLMVWRMTIKNQSNREKEFRVFTDLRTSLRTSHTYAQKTQARIEYVKSGTIGLASFDEADTDSTQIFVVNAAEMPLSKGESASELLVSNPRIFFEYQNVLNPSDEMSIVQLIGSCRQFESKDIISKVTNNWQKSAQTNTQRISDYVWNQAIFSIADSTLQQTADWSKALMATNIHYINDWVVPMPCPAEYNFFFTHDLLLTDLGGVLFDLDYVKNGYYFLHSLTKKDSILPHAYYWKDDGFKTEFCKTDNWNHLWFIITVSSYLKHSADKKTVALLYPTVQKSLKMMLDNKGDDDLMYASRPDWWDAGNSYGARVYITTLMIKVLKDYVFIASALGINDEDLNAYLELAERMKTELVERLWDDNIGFLMNMLDQTRLDDHYYSGSIVAAYLEVLDNTKRARLLETTREKLLDNNIGIRNAMPADFHKLIDVYQFQGMEMGEPYFYFNGGVWPHGNAWYALGLLANEQPDKAKGVIKKYLTLGGITHSPNGQPSLYEFRITDRASPRYGEIDKPSFLWAGGWYLHTLYQLAGLRENSWNIFFSPILPQGFENVEYDLTLFGDLCRIKWRGQGDYFGKITIDGQSQYSAVTVSSARNITLERGIPETPYLAEAHCLIKDVSFSSFNKELTIKFWGIIGQIADLVIISPYQLQKSELNEMEFHDGIHGSNLDDVYTYIIKVKLNGIDNEVILGFK